MMMERSIAGSKDHDVLFPIQSSSNEKGLEWTKLEKKIKQYKKE